MEKNEYRLVIDINDMVGDDAISSQSQDTSQGNDKIANTLKRLVKYQVAQPYIQSTKQMILNNVDTYYGSSELSQRIQIGLNTAHNIYSGAVMGISLGSALGIGAVAGAGLGLALMVGQKLLDIAVKQNEINNKQRLENEQLNILRGRAGIQFNRSRSGE